jgi:glycosyltransferase involved in cell wall biosynthesis
MKKKILFLSNFGPYRTGLVVFNQCLIEGEDNIDFIPVEISKWYILIALFHIIRYRTKTSRAYITITDRSMGFLKDFFLILLMKILFYKIKAHSHSGNIANYLDKGYGRFYDICINDLIILSNRFMPQSLNKCNVHVVGNIPSNIFYQPLEAERKNQILYVGALTEAKGVLRALEGFCIFHKKFPNYEMLFLGKFFSEKTKKEAFELIKSNNLEGKVSFRYAKSAEEVRLLMFESKFMVFPSYYITEGFPLVIVEAACSGCYIISTDWRAIPDILDGIPSTVLKGENMEQKIAKELTLLVNTEIDHNKIRELALIKFSESRFFSKMKSILD